MVKEMELPRECVDCTKTGMNAINCDVIGRVPEIAILDIHCATEHENTNDISGGEFVSTVYFFNGANKEPKIFVTSANPRIGK